MPSLVHSASLHPDKSTFVWGGDDFKVYKYDYADGTELGKVLFFELKFKNEQKQPNLV